MRKGKDKELSARKAVHQAGEKCRFENTWYDHLTVFKG
jgi:hypothetical protein